MADFNRIFPHGLTGIVFDCDGVMIDSRTANSFFYNRVLAYFDLPPMTPEQEHYSFMATGMQALKHILPVELHGQINYVISKVINYEHDIVPMIKMMPGFLDFTHTCHAWGLRQAVLTNRTDSGIQSVLDFFALPSYFNPVVTASNSQPKPSPDGVKKICSIWNTRPEDILLVGDSQHDLKAAIDSGAAFAAFKSEGLDGDIKISNFVELRDTIIPLMEKSIPETSRRV